MRVLLDTDVVLDLYLDRLPFADASAKLWTASADGTLDAYVSAITPINLYYIARKLRDNQTARQAVIELLLSMRVCPTDHTSLRAALDLSLRDYEDAVQVASALALNLEAVITRNLDDYKPSPVPVYTPVTFLEKFLPTYM